MNWKSSICVVAATSVLTGVSLAQQVRLVPEERTEENFPGKREGYRSESGSSMEMKPLQMKMLMEGADAMEGNMSIKVNEQNQAELIAEGEMRLIRKRWGTTITDFGGQQSKQPVEDALADLPVIMKETEKGTEARLESGAEPTLEQQLALSELELEYESLQELNNWDTIVATYGDEPREVGESWEMDQEALNRLMPSDLGDGVEADIELTEGTISLDGVEEIQGVKHALLTVLSKMTMKGVQADTGMGMTMEAEMEVKIMRNLEEFYDAETSTKLSGDVKMNMEDQAAGFSMEMKGPMEMTWKQKDSLPVTTQ